MKKKCYFLDEVFQEDEVDVAIIWHLTLLSETIRGAPGHVMLAHRKEIDEILELITKFHCRDANFVFFLLRNCNK
jgi:hypothetical protein